MLAAGQDRATPVVPQRQQLVQLVGALVGSGALERLGQQRVRQRLPRDPLGIQRVGLAALTRAVLPWRAVGAHVAHVMPPADEEDRRVASPPGGVLDPPTRDRAELARPRLKRPVPATGHLKVLRGHDPAARIGDRRRQRLLVRIDAHHVAGMIRRQQQVRRSRPALLGSPHLDQSSAVCCWRTGRQHPGGRPLGGKHSLSSQADPRRHEPRPTLHAEDTPRRGVRLLWSQASVQPSTLREPSPARAPRFNTGIAFASAGAPAALWQCL